MNFKEVFKEKKKEALKKYLCRLETEVNLFLDNDITNFIDAFTNKLKISVIGLEEPANESYIGYKDDFSDYYERIVDVKRDTLEDNLVINVSCKNLFVEWTDEEKEKINDEFTKIIEEHLKNDNEVTQGDTCYNFEISLV